MSWVEVHGTVVEELTFTDPVLPAELLTERWPGDELRTAYTGFAVELVERRDARLRDAQLDAQLMEAT